MVPLNGTRRAVDGLRRPDLTRSAPKHAETDAEHLRLSGPPGQPPPHSVRTCAPPQLLGQSRASSGKSSPAPASRGRPPHPIRMPASGTGVSASDDRGSAKPCARPVLSTRDHLQRFVEDRLPGAVQQRDASRSTHALDAGRSGGAAWRRSSEQARREGERGAAGQPQHGATVVAPGRVVHHRVLPNAARPSLITRGTARAGSAGHPRARSAGTIACRTPSSRWRRSRAELGLRSRAPSPPPRSQTGAPKSTSRSMP